MREMEAGFNVMNESKTYVLLRHLGVAETTSLMRFRPPLIENLI
jgi:hypothetical protein